MISYSEQIGDGAVQKLEIDFKHCQTTLHLERWGSKKISPELIIVLFRGVGLQEFKDFGDATVLFDIEEELDPAAFWHGQDDYLQQRINYLPKGLVQKLTEDTFNRYFEVSSSCGFQGFVICKSFEILVQE